VNLLRINTKLIPSAKHLLILLSFTEQLLVVHLTLAMLQYLEQSVAWPDTPYLCYTDCITILAFVLHLESSSYILYFIYYIVPFPFALL